MEVFDLGETARFAPSLELAADKPLVQVDRGEFVENIHRGTIAVADVAGAPVAGCGDVQQRAFLRSGAKPFQAMAAVLVGGIERFGVTQPELAVLCSSHSGEPRHLEAVLSVLSKIGLDEGALQCGVHPPLNPRVAADRRRLGLEPTPVCNNCSGSHAGLLMACVAAGWSIDDYGDREHPVQISIRNIVTHFAGAEEGELEDAVDNCGVPTFRLPLLRTATAFARLGSSEGVPDDLARAARAVRTAMTAYPELVGGENQFDSDLMSAVAGHLVSKGGAEGFQGVGVVDGDVGLALKISDGDDAAAATATVHALTLLGLLSSEALASMNSYRRPLMQNLRGETVGRGFPVFQLRQYR